MNPKMDSILSILFWGIVMTIVVGFIVGGFLLINSGVETAIESESIYPEKTMEPVDSFDVVTPFGELTIHNTMYVVHDDDRNVTCYLYDDGISCIPDRYLEEVEK